METDIDVLLKYDPLLEAEKITGKSYKEDKATSFLGMRLASAKNIAKNQALKELGDTYWAMSWDEFKEKILGSVFKFKEVYKQEFQNKKGEYDEEVVFYDATRGIIIHADSYSSKSSVNGANAYYQIDFGKGKVDYRLLPGSCHCVNFLDTTCNVWVSKIDAREAILYRLLQIDFSEYDFLKEWYKPESLWLYNWLDFEKVRDNKTSYDEIRENKIKLLPKEVAEKWAER